MKKQTLCPRCQQDALHRIQILGIEQIAVACPECDALWLDESAISDWPKTYGVTWFDLGTFLANRGDSHPGRRWPGKGQTTGHGFVDLGAL